MEVSPSFIGCYEPPDQSQMLFWCSDKTVHDLTNKGLFAQLPFLGKVDLLPLPRH